MGVGKTERGTRERSCGEVGGAGAEVVFPLSFSFVSIFLLSFDLLSYI